MGGDGNYDVIVAMHEYGKGVVAYFGDVNAERETIWLVAAFVEYLRLEIEWGHVKCSYRRAIARFKISQGTSGGDLILLRKAKEDVLNAGGASPKAAEKLMSQIENEIKRLEKRERKHFSASFQNALSGKLG